MNLRWLILDYVDPQLNLTKAERRRVRDRAWNVGWHHSPQRDAWRRPAVLAQIIAPAFLSFSPMFAWMLMGQPRNYSFLLVFPGSLVYMWIGCAWIARYTWRPNVVRALREFGYDVCLTCGYWLRGLGENVKQCPECGAAREAMPTTTREPGD